MRTPEDPCRDPASEARDDWEDREPRATPDTDAITFDPYPWNQNGPGRSHYPEVMYPCDDGDWVDADFCRRLERQRDELTDRWEKSANAFLIEQGKREAAERQRDELLEALEDIAFGTVIKRASGGCGQRQLSSAIEMSQHAEAAIAAVKGGRDE